MCSKKNVVPYGQRAIQSYKMEQTWAGEGEGGVNLHKRQSGDRAKSTSKTELGQSWPSLSRMQLLGSFADAKELPGLRAVGN